VFVGGSDVFVGGARVNVTLGVGASVSVGSGVSLGGISVSVGVDVGVSVAVTVGVLDGCKVPVWVWVGDDV
jgi:hypothetical protein